MRAIACAMVLLSGSAGWAVVDDPDTEVAKRHFKRGSTLYQEGRYAEAIAEFSAARSAKPLPAFEYNIGRAHERLGQWDEALIVYRRYLALAPATPDGAEVRARIALLEARTRRPAATEGPVAVQRPLAVDRPLAAAGPPVSGLRPAAWAVGALALGTAATASGLYGSAAVDFPDLQNACRQRGCVPADWAGAERRANAGYALWALSGALAVVDIALIIADARRRARVAVVRRPALPGGSVP